MANQARKLALSSIRVDDGTQLRELSSDQVREYSEAMEAGAKFPPVVVFKSKGGVWLADGFHRWHAAEKVGAKQIAVEIHEGDQRAAVLYSVGANATHGQRRSNADKHRAVEKLLADKEWSQWSDREIARRCAVGYDLVAELRRKHLPEPADTPRKVTRKGKTYRQQKASKPSKPKKTASKDGPQSPIGTPPEVSGPPALPFFDHQDQCLLDVEASIQHAWEKLGESERLELMIRLRNLLERFGKEDKVACQTS